MLFRSGADKLTDVVLGSSSVGKIASATNTQIVVHAAAGAKVKDADVTILADTGATITGKGAWSYSEEGAIAKVDPAQGQRGTYVTITGARLRGGGSEVKTVHLANVQADIISETDSTIRVRAIHGATGRGHVVLTADTGALVTQENGWEYVAVGVITSISPAIGQLNTAVTITGTNLLGNGKAVSTVKLAGVMASIRSQTNTQLVVVANSSRHSSGNQVVLLADTGAIVDVAEKWTYINEGIIKQINPAVGQIGTVVAISGERLRGSGSKVVRVALAGAAATIKTESDTSLVVQAVQSKAGRGDVVLTSETEATVTLRDGWTYAEEGVIKDVSPATGQYGTRVTVQGERLRGAGQNVKHVTLGGVPVWKIVSETDDAVVVDAAHANASASAGAVVLTANTGAVVTGAERWQYLARGQIDTVQPARGQYGTRVVISGARLLGGGSKLRSVTLAGIVAKQVSAENDQVSVVAQTNPSSGRGAVVFVADTGAIITKPDGFEYLKAGVIEKVEPSAGQVGTYVTITGSSLLGGGDSYSNIMLGGQEVLKRVSVDDSELIVRANNNTAGKGDVTLVSDSGSVVSLVGGWVQHVASEINTVSPSFGQLGTRVTLKGTNLLGVANGKQIDTVTLAGVTARIVQGTSQSEIIIVAAHYDGTKTGAVFIQANSGAYHTMPDAWTYNEIGVITSVTPDVGQLNTLVTIAGKRLLGGGKSVLTATLAGAKAAVVFTSPTMIKVTVPKANASSGAIVIISDSGAVVTSKLKFTFGQQGSIAKVSPSSGQHNTQVAITGTHLRGHGSKVASVHLAGVKAAIKTQTDTEVVVTAASGKAQAGATALVADTGATITLTDSWKYVASPTIEKVFPKSGQVGTLVTITGTGLRAGGPAVTQVKLVDTEVTKIHNESDTEIIVEVAQGPTRLTTGSIEITTTHGATVTSDAVKWSYIDQGKISSVLPDTGRVGTRVTVLGIDLCGGGAKVVKVTLANYEATIEDNSECGVVVVTARDFGSNAVGDVQATSDTGSRVTLKAAWTYIAEGEITAVTPAAGQGNTRVTITGKSLFGGADDVKFVTFSGVGAFVDKVRSNTQLVADRKSTRLNSSH